MTQQGAELPGLLLPLPHPQSSDSPGHRSADRWVLLWGESTGAGSLGNDTSYSEDPSVATRQLYLPA